MRQTFRVTSPAADLSLLTIEQLRAAAGLASDDDSQDAELEPLGEAIAADIATACRTESDGVNPPTLKEETVVETFWNCDRADEVFLSRRFVSSVSAVSERETALTTDDYVLDAEAGMLRRVIGGRPWAWYTGDLSVTYVAGFATVPADLVAIATDLARHRLSAAAVDPLEKATTIEIPDVETRRVDRWVGAMPGSNAGPVPADIVARLSRYMNVAIG